MYQKMQILSASEISKLTTAGIIETSLSNQLISLHNSVFKRVPGSPLPLYAETSNPGKPARGRKYSPYVPIKHKEKEMHIHKTTAVWLLQEGERVSADRLFRAWVANRIRYPRFRASASETGQ